MKELLLFFVPRYVTDRVALFLQEDGSYEVFCLEKNVQSGDEIFIDAYGTVKTFTWLGLALGDCLETPKLKDPQ